MGLAIFHSGTYKKCGKQWPETNTHLLERKWAQLYNWANVYVSFQVRIAHAFLLFFFWRHSSAKRKVHNRWNGVGICFGSACGYSLHKIHGSSANCVASIIQALSLLVGCMRIARRNVVWKWPWQGKLHWLFFNCFANDTLNLGDTTNLVSRRYGRPPSKPIRLHAVITFECDAIDCVRKWMFCRWHCSLCLNFANIKFICE